MSGMAGYQTQSADTHPEVERMLIERWRGMSAGEKLRIVDELTMAARAMAMAGLRSQYPNEGEESIRLRLAERILGRDTVLQAYGRVPV